MGTQINKTTRTRTHARTHLHKEIYMASKIMLNFHPTIEANFKSPLDNSEMKPGQIIHVEKNRTYLVVAIWERSGTFSGRLFLRVPTEFSESWERNDLSLHLLPRLLTLPELSEPFRRRTDGVLPLSDESISSPGKRRKQMLNLVHGAKIKIKCSENFENGLTTKQEVYSYPVLLSQ